MDYSIRCKKGSDIVVNILFCVFIHLILCACTFSVTMVHTEGQATDVVDETATNTPSTSVSIPVSAARTPAIL